METVMLTRDKVIERRNALPSFPRVVTEILATLDDPDANLKALVNHIQHDPVIAAQLLSQANRAAAAKSRGRIHDLYTATSLIGLNGVREITLCSSMNSYFAACLPSGGPAMFWQHSIAVGICSEELARHAEIPVVAHTALIAGLLHDIGQLWLHCFSTDKLHTAWHRALTDSIGIDAAEREQFGADHTMIGSWLAEYWGIPSGICAAIRHHHAPDAFLDEPLVPLTHIAEVLSNALDLTGREENRVTTISTPACRKLGLQWNDSAKPLFGRIEARSRHVTSLFNGH